MNDGFLTAEEAITAFRKFGKFLEQHSLDGVLRGSTEVRTRIINVMAKNIQIGDVIEWPGGTWAEIAGWGHYTKEGVVVISGPQSRLASYPENQRLRVSRCQTS